MSSYAVCFLILLSAFAARADFAGSAKLEEDGFFKSQNDPVQTDETSLNLEMRLKYELTDWMRVRIEPQGRFSSAPDIVDDTSDSDWRDTSVETKFGVFRLQAGNFIKAWEGTDGVNPMDIATVKNLRDPFSGENLSSTGLALAAGQGFFTIDGLYVPHQTPARLPGNDSPWWPRQATLPLESDTDRLLVPGPPDSPQYQILPRKEVNDALEDNWGVRAQLHGDSWDFSLATFEGAAQTPYLQPVITADPIDLTPGQKSVFQLKNPVDVVPVEYRRRTYAGALVYTHDTWIFRVAGRHDEPVGNGPVFKLSEIGNVDPSQDPALPTWSDQYVVGLEKTYTIHGQNVIFSLQDAYGTSPESSGLVSASDIFRRAVLAGVRWPWNDNLLFALGGFVDTQHGGGYGKLSVQYKLRDPLTLEFTVEGTDGPDDSLLGVWRDQKRAGLSLLYQL